MNLIYSSKMLQPKTVENHYYRRWKFFAIDFLNVAIRTFF